MNSISERLKGAISRRQYTLKAAAAASGVPYRSLQKYSSGEQEPGAEALSRLCVGLAINADWLLLARGPMGWEDVPDQAPTEAPTPTPTGMDEDLLAWTIAGVLGWLDRERAAAAPEPTSRLVIGTFRVICGMSPRPDTPEIVAQHVAGVLDGFRHLIR